MKYLLIFEEFEERIKSKSQIKRELWYLNNLNRKGTVLKIEDVSKYSIPESIIDMMRSWETIYKSPYSKSFYSSSDISWGNKPDRSYRVSDHWNFLSGKLKDKISCPTDISVENNTHWSIGQFNKNKNIYEIIHSEKSAEEISKELKRIENNKHLKDEKTIAIKRQFKKEILNNNLYAKVLFNGEKYFGKVDKYTGNDVRLKDKNNNVIFTQNYFKNNSKNIITLYDANGNKVDNPLI